jgi:hypothetical protein
MSWHLRLEGLIISIIWSGFIVWTIRRYWRAPLDASGKSYHTYGKVWGLGLLIGLALYVPLETPFPGLPYPVAALFIGFIGLPISIVFGHVYGRTMQAIDRRRSGR